MNQFENITSSQLKLALQLIEKRELHQHEIERINAELAKLQANHTVQAPSTISLGLALRPRRGRPPKALSAMNAIGAPASPKAGRRRGAPGKLKDAIIRLLKASGNKGLLVSDIASELKKKPQNIFSWFYTTGEKIKGIEKIGKAHYAYKGD
jgi:hypothetical protein